MTQSTQNRATTAIHLDEELIPPTVKSLKALARVDVVHKHAAVGTAVECHAERLEALLAGSVPQLHGHDAVIDHELASEEVGACGSMRSIDDDMGSTIGRVECCYRTSGRRGAGTWRGWRAEHEGWASARLWVRVVNVRADFCRPLVVRHKSTYQ